MLLCEAGVDQEKANVDVATPLHAAALNGHLDMVKLLCEAGVDKEKAAVDGATPLHVAALIGHLDIVKFLREVGVDKAGRNERRDGGSHHLAFIGQCPVQCRRVAA